MEKNLLSREQVRELDRRAIQEFAVPGVVLMENAGRGCVDTLWQLGISGPVLICCGAGNNAGDGLVMARHLDLRAVRVQLLFWSDPRQLRGDAATNYEMVRAAQLPVHVFDASDPVENFASFLSGVDWIVDALLGTGAQGDPRPPLDQVIDRLNQQPARKLAVDIPSGLDCDTGRPSRHTFQADHTCTFVAAKPGLVADSGRSVSGKLHVIDIGVPSILLREFGVSGHSRPETP